MCAAPGGTICCQLLPVVLFSPEARITQSVGVAIYMSCMYEHTPTAAATAPALLLPLGLCACVRLLLCSALTCCCTAAALLLHPPLLSVYI